MEIDDSWNSSKPSKEARERANELTRIRAMADMHTVDQAIDRNDGILAVSITKVAIYIRGDGYLVVVAGDRNGEHLVGFGSIQELHEVGSSIVRILRKDLWKPDKYKQNGSSPSNESSFDDFDKIS